MSSDGRERLIAAVRQRARLQSAELFAQLFAEIREFSNCTEFSDDVCLWAWRLRGSAIFVKRAALRTRFNRTLGVDRDGDELVVLSSQFETSLVLGAT